MWKSMRSITQWKPFLPEDFSQDTDRVGRFQREGRIAGVFESYVCTDVTDLITS